MNRTDILTHLGEDYKAYFNAPALEICLSHQDMTKLEKFIDDLKCFNCGFLWLNKVIMNH